jgi:CDP-glucose 4,6-dehydratase
LSGYLWLAALLADPALAGSPPLGAALLQDAFNFGPRLESNRTVAQLVSEILDHHPGQWEDRSDPHAPHEASLLNLAIEKAFHILHWHPAWNFEESVAQTVTWYLLAAKSLDSPQTLTRAQIAAYTDAARAASLRWATG